MLHKCTYNNLFSCFEVATRRTHNNSSSSITYFSHIVPCTSSAVGSASRNERWLCKPRHNTCSRSTLKSTETGDASRGRRFLNNLKRFLIYLVSGPTYALLAICSFLCLFFRAGVVASSRLERDNFYLCLANHSAVGKSQPAEGSGLYATAGFLTAAKFAVRCARRSVLVVVHPTCAVRCSFVLVTFLFPTATTFF